MFAFPKIVFAIGLAGAASALAATDPEKRETREHKVIIIQSDAGEKGDPSKRHLSVTDCGADPQVDVKEEVKDKDGKVRKSQILLCARNAGSGKEMVARLEEARARLAAVDELSPETRAKALAAIDAAIARQRGLPAQ
jgi:hypothetical protein